MKPFGIVYLIWNMVNGKKYVGQTIQPLEKRFNAHKYADSLLGRAIRKYGAENFRYGVIKTCSTKAELNAYEKHFIAVLHSKAPYGYNLTDSGDCDYIISDEARAIMSAKRKGVPKSPEHRAKIKEALSGEKHYFFGHHHTKETRARISASQSGEKHYFFGKHHTDKSRSKMSIARRGYSPSKNLIAELDALQMSYKALAELMGLSPANIARKMRGKRKFTERDKIKLEEIFGKPAEYLLQRDDE